MQNRLKIALVVAVFFGLIASYGIYNFLRQQRQAAEALRQETQNVVVAAKEIPAGTAFNDDMIGLKGIAKRAVFVLDKNGVVRYREVLDDARNEPNYDKVYQAVASAGESVS